MVVLTCVHLHTTYITVAGNSISSQLDSSCQGNRNGTARQAVQPVHHSTNHTCRGTVPQLKGQCHEIFASGSFHESVSPQPQSIPLRPFRIFSKIRGDIRSSRFATGVNDTGGKWKKSSIRKIVKILFGHLWVVEETYI
jgi:hypothetical protein